MASRLALPARHPFPLCKTWDGSLTHSDTTDSAAQHLRSGVSGCPAFLAFKSQPQPGSGEVVSAFDHLMPSSQAAGQHCFLANASVLEAVLLPHLGARAIIKLACTCRGLRAWLYQAPPTIWQQVRCRLKIQTELVCKTSTSSVTARRISACRTQAPATLLQRTRPPFLTQLPFCLPCARPMLPCRTSRRANNLSSSISSLWSPCQANGRTSLIYSWPQIQLCAL